MPTPCTCDSCPDCELTSHDLEPDPEGCKSCGGPVKRWEERECATCHWDRVRPDCWPEDPERSAW